jgi:hypothetical protein
MQSTSRVSGPIDVQQFAGGQSNPTFLVQSPTRRYVLRRKPPGKLLPSAHAVDREFRVLAALEGTAVPVAHAIRVVRGPGRHRQRFLRDGICRGPHLLGRIAARGGGAPERAPSTWRWCGCWPLAFGGLPRWASATMANPGHYVERQVALDAQYRAAETEKIESMERLIEWLPKHIPADEQTSIVHGDFRLDNTIFIPREPRILAVLDWELSTLGHPLVDFAFLLLRLSPAQRGISRSGRRGCRQQLSIPSEAECVAEYCAFAASPPVPPRIGPTTWRFACSAWPDSARGAGARPAGQCLERHGAAAGRRARPLAELGWRSGARIVRRPRID